MQYELNLRDYIRIFQKRKWIIILMPVLAGLLGYFLTPVPPLLYEARGKLQISSRALPTEAMVEVFYSSLGGGSRLDTHAEVLTSREVLKEVAINLGLIQQEADASGRKIPISDEELMRRQDYVGHIEALRSSIRAEVIPATSILEISVTRPRPDQAIRWLNTLLDTYATRNSYELNKAVIDSLAFLQNKLSETEAALRTAETELTQFKLDNAETISLATDEVARTQEDLEATANDLRAINRQIELLDQAIESGTIPSPELLNRVSIDDPRIEISRSEVMAREAKRRELLLYQTPRSPEVIALEQQIQAALADMRSAFAAARDRTQRQRDRLQAKFQVLPANDVTLARLQRNVEVNETLYNDLRRELQQAQLRDAGKLEEVTVIERAVNAALVTETGRGSKGLAAAVIGLLLGIVVAMVVETLDTSIGAIEDVEALLDLRVIGIIPPINFDAIRSAVRGTAPQLLEHPDIHNLLSLVTHYDPRSPVSEAYRALRTNVDQAREKVDGRVFIVTSSVLEEGKTTTAANLALTFAQMGRKTLLVAADLRRPDLHRIFGLQREPGLADVLTGSITWESASRSLSDVLLGELSMDVVMLTPGMDNLHVLPSGSNPLNPAELLSSDATGVLFAELREAFDLIIIDTPPIIPVTDSAILAEHTDGVVMVYEVGKVGRDVLKRAKSHLDNVHANIWGIVMNDVKAEAETSLRDTDYYYYNYRYENVPSRRGVKLKLKLGKTAARFFGRRR
ncbi:MAG: GumC family protein [Acidobacteriota bacterium]